MFRSPEKPPREGVLAVRAFLVLYLGAAIVGAVLFARFMIAERRARLALDERLGAIEVGWTEAQVRATAGAPDDLCEGDGHLAKRAPESRAFFVDRSLVRRLAAQTDRRFIYRSVPRRDDEDACLPGYADSELGFGADGRLLWYVRFTNESYLVADRPQ